MKPTQHFKKFHLIFYLWLKFKVWYLRKQIELIFRNYVCSKRFLKKLFHHWDKNKKHNYLE
jgi:hypothetical protein